MTLVEKSSALGCYGRVAHFPDRKSTRFSLGSATLLEGPGSITRNMWERAEFL
jgi:hypothetical protein